MALLTISITDQSMARKSDEVAFAQYAVAEALKEFGRGNGTITSGTIIAAYGAGVAPASLGSWTYTPSAPNP